MKNYDPEVTILRQMLALSIIEKLEECGFELCDPVDPRPTKTTRWSKRTGWAPTVERVYTRNITPDGRVKVKVFSTVIEGSDGSPVDVRERGEDAIRVCATYRTNSGEERGLVKVTRVHRTGDIEDIVDRMYQRMRKVWKAAASGPRCSNCDAPMFTTKKGNQCCAEICWKTEDEKKKDDLNFRHRRKRRRYGRQFV
jgi:hypothetical protein